MDAELFLLAQNVRTMFAAHLSGADLHAQAARYLDYISENHMTIGGIEVRQVSMAAVSCMV